MNIFPMFIDNFFIVIYNFIMDPKEAVAIKLGKKTGFSVYQISKEKMYWLLGKKFSKFISQTIG